MSYAVTLAVTTDIHLADEQARDVAARWAAAVAKIPGAAGFDLGMTSTSREDPWLRVSGLLHWTDNGLPDVALAAAMLEQELATAGAQVTEWEAVEVWSPAELQRRSGRPTIPPMVNAGEFAELAGYKTRQAIYQLESDRAAGKRADFPAPVLDGYWLRSAAEHWARNRRRKPGPAPRTAGDPGATLT
ncbi:hypothetical protein ACU61A_15960 [Pseudonocardia sichuanensis]